MEVLRAAIPPLLGLLTVWLVDIETRRRGLEPPWFQIPSGADTARRVTARVRRLLALSLLWLVLWLGVFLPLGSLGVERELDLSRLSRFDLFLLHLLLMSCLVLWYLCGYIPRFGSERQRREGGWIAQFGLRSESILREIGIGLAVGIVAWLVVIAALLAIGIAVWWIGGDEWLPQQPPELIPWIAALPVGVRLLISLSAGVVEEAFFRGFLQPRIGLWLSSALFVIAHASYEQPLMLVGVSMLSLVYAGLVLWRQSIWAAVVAHSLFDAVQLLVVIPAALRVLPGGADGTIVFL